MGASSFFGSLLSWLSCVPDRDCNDKEDTEILSGLLHEDNHIIHLW